MTLIWAVGGAVLLYNTDCMTYQIVVHVQTLCVAI